MYNASKHAVFSQRVEAWMKQAQELRDEASRLNLIYTSEAASGADSAFVDTAIATKQEHIDGIVFMRTFRDFCAGTHEDGTGGGVTTIARDDRTSNIAAFIQ